MKTFAREIVWALAAAVVAVAAAWCYFGGAWPAPRMEFVAPYAVETVDPWLTTMRVASDLAMARYVMLGVRGWLRARRIAPPRALPWLFTWIGCVVTLLAFVAMALLPHEFVQAWVRPMFPVVALLQPLEPFGEQSREIAELVLWLAAIAQWPICGAAVDAVRRLMRRDRGASCHEASA